MAKLLLVDLDGTIREPLSGEKFIRHPRDQRIIKGADKALAHYHARGWLCLGISNQGGVAAKFKTLEDCIDEQIYTLELFPQLNKIYFCPDFEGKQLGCVYRGGHQIVFSPTGYSSFRKPEPGMLEYCLSSHDAERIWYVGDRLEDQKAAEKAGINYLPAAAWRDRFLPRINPTAPGATPSPVAAPL